jgi:hypothetical protein
MDIIDIIVDVSVNVNWYMSFDFSDGPAILTSARCQQNIAGNIPVIAEFL